MSNNKHYWTDAITRAKTAREHTDLMYSNHLSDINYSIQHSRVIDEINFTNKVLFPGRYNPVIVVENIDSVSSVLKESQSAKTCVLNFASFKKPGGMFLEGSMAQEEALCHASDLYNVLSDERFEKEFYGPNKSMLNKALYQNRGIYSPQIYFEANNVSAYCDVLTCAAPNFSAASQYQHVSYSDNLLTLEYRIKFVLQCLEQSKVETIILGAFGCGVFDQDPKAVARLFMDTIHSRTWNFKKAVFAVIGKNSEYETFKNTASEFNA